MYRLARCLLDPARPRAPAPVPGPEPRAPGPGPGARTPGPLPELRPPARAPGPGPRPWAPGPGLRGCAGNPIMYPAVRCSLDPLSLIRFRSSPSCTCTRDLHSEATTELIRCNCLNCPGPPRNVQFIGGLSSHLGSSKFIVIRLMFGYVVP